MTARSLERGFSLVELAIALAIGAAIAGGIFALVGPAQDFLAAERDRTDLRQRIRAANESLLTDLLMAGAGGQAPAVAPYRRGDFGADPPAAAFADRLSIRFVPPDGTIADVITRTYWLRRDRSGAGELMRYDGRRSDLPDIDHVLDLRFDYFGDGGMALPLERFADGPWLADPLSGTFDADLLAVRRVRVILRVRSARELVPSPWRERETRFDVTPRNLNLR